MSKLLIIRCISGFTKDLPLCYHGFTADLPAVLPP